MRLLLAIPLALVGTALVLPASKPESIPLSGIKLVAEHRATDGDWAAAGKNGNSGKNGKTGKNGKGSYGSAGQAAGALGGYGGYAYGTYSFFGTNRLAAGPEGPELVAVELR